MFASHPYEPQYGQEDFGFHRWLELQHHKHATTQPINNQGQKKEQRKSVIKKKTAICEARTQQMPLNSNFIIEISHQQIDLMPQTIKHYGLL